LKTNIPKIFKNSVNKAFKIFKAVFECRKHMEHKIYISTKYADFLNIKL